jgi:IclR family KDG regulon transcriptional repressor
MSVKSHSDTKMKARTDMVGKALGLLVLLGDEPRGASAADLARSAGLPFSTTYRLLGSLTRDGFVDYEPDGRRYHLGLRIFQLGQRVSNHHGFAGHRVARLAARHRAHP